MTITKLNLLFLTPDTPGLAVGEVWWYLDKIGLPYTKITHPIAPVPRARISNLNGRSVRREPKLGPVSHLTDFVLTVTPILRNLPGYYDYAICITPHMALAGLWLKKMGKVDKVIYWALDYYPKRYGEGSKIGGGKLGNLVEGVYRRLERKLIRDCDILWAVTNVMQEGWRESGYTWTAPFRKVPNMIRTRRESLDWEQRKAHLIWSGTAREGEGLELISDNWEYLKKELGKQGKTRPELAVTCRTKFPAKFSNFTRSPGVYYFGFLPSLEEVHKLVAGSLASLATYQTPSYKKYSDASRIKSALAVGVPSIVSGIQELGQEVQDWGAGVLIPYEKESLVKAVEFLMDEQENTKASLAAYELAGEYLAERIVQRELSFLEEAK